MVYVDEKGRRYEVQYCVVLSEDKNAGLRRYVWASKEEIENVMEKAEKLLSCSIEDNGDKLVCRGILKGEDYEITFNPSRIGSLEIGVRNSDSVRNVFFDLSRKNLKRV